MRHSDGSAGDANYGTIGKNYTNCRQPEFNGSLYLILSQGRSIP